MLTSPTPWLTRVWTWTLPAPVSLPCPIRKSLALADQLDHAPAGAGGVLGTIVLIFLLLLITDILGFTKVYPFTRSIR